MPIRFLALSYFTMNVVAGAISLVLFLALVFAHVRTGQSATIFQSPVLATIIMGVAFVGFCLTTWPAIQGSRVARATLTAFMALPVFAIWMCIAVLIGYWFHFVVGGVE